MKTYESDKLRNVALIGHNGSGKTTITETLLFDFGIITRLGKVEEGTTASDHQPEEIKRKISIVSTLFGIEWNGNKINLIDTPGYIDFIGEVISALRVTDAALFNFCAVTGIGVGAELMWKHAQDNKLPIIAFINRMDKERANFGAVVDKLRDTFGKSLAPIQVPIGAESNFKGVIDLIKMKAYEFEGGLPAGKAGKPKEVPVPADIDLSAYKEMLIEALADVDDTLLTDYMEGKEITEEEMVSALKKGVAEAKVIPVLCGSAARNIGISLLCEMIRDYVPPPAIRPSEGTDPSTGAKVTRKPDKSEPFSAFIFKSQTEAHVGELSFVKIYSGTLVPSSSVYNASKGQSERVGQIHILQGKNRFEVGTLYAGDIAVLPKLKTTETNETLCDQHKPIVYPAMIFPQPVYNLAVRPKSKEDQEKIGLAFHTFSKEDLTFKIRYDPETKDTVISGMGDVHLDVIMERFRRQFGVEVETGPPRIPFKETIKSRAKAQGKYKRQTGGRGQYGDTWLELEPLPKGRGFEFVDKVVGGAIPRNYIPSVEKGVRGAMEEGVIAGYHVVDVKVTLYDGTYHEVDSSDMAFKIAGSMGFKKAFQEAKPIVLEPITEITVMVPREYVGEVMGDLNKRRGRILDMDESQIRAQVPVAEIAKYAIDLRSLTHGRGYFTTKFSHYEEAPAKTQEELITKYQKERSKEEVA